MFYWALDLMDYRICIHLTKKSLAIKMILLHNMWKSQPPILLTEENYELTISIY
jgi:hypothetical protein